jgi:hypothetical protein
LFLSRKSRKRSSKGEPGGNCGISGRCRSAFRVWVVEMFTTAGLSCLMSGASEVAAGTAEAGGLCGVASRQSLASAGTLPCACA